MAHPCIHLASGCAAVSVDDCIGNVEFWMSEMVTSGASNPSIVDNESTLEIIGIGWSRQGNQGS
jgi:hypothetical protein